MFELHAPYKPQGDQPQAIGALTDGLERGYPERLSEGAGTQRVVDAISELQEPCQSVALQRGVGGAREGGDTRPDEVGIPRSRLPLGGSSRTLTDTSRPRLGITQWMTKLTGRTPKRSAPNSTIFPDVKLSPLSCFHSSPCTPAS